MSREHPSSSEARPPLRPSRILFEDWYAECMAQDPTDKMRRKAEAGKAMLNDLTPYILYNDTDSLSDGNIIAINKPPFITTHENGRIPPYGLTEVLQLATQNSVLFNCHRLDTDTTGVILFAKNKTAITDMYKRTAARTPRSITKTYLALMQGVLKPKLTGAVLPLAGTDGLRRFVAEPDMPLPEHSLERSKYNSGKPKISGTSFRPLTTYEDSNGKPWTLAAVRLHTGRTHQIRVVSSYLGHPIYGDPLYHPQAASTDRQLLHAYELKLNPIPDDQILTQPLTIQAPLPQDFKDVLKSMRVQEAYNPQLASLLDLDAH